MAIFILSFGGATGNPEVQKSQELRVAVLWSMLKTGYQGAIHRLNRKCHGRCVAEFVDLHNFRERHIVAQA